MDERDLNSAFGRGQQRVLRNLTNIFGKRPLSLDSEKPNNEKKVGRYQESAPSAHQEGARQDSNRESQFHLIKENVAARQDSNRESQFHLIKENVLKDKGIMEAPPENYRHVYDKKGKCIDTKENFPPYFGSSKLSPESQEDSVDDNETDDVDTWNCARRTEIDLNRSVDFNESNLDFFNRMETRLQFDGGGCSSQDCPLGSSKPSGPANSEMVGLKEFSKLHAAPIGESVEGQTCINLDKSCTCSFCLKALKKSSILARRLLGKCNDHECAFKTTSESSQQSTDTEFQLMQHWRSLFLHTENVLVQETANLQSTLQRLSKLRENCKRDLEMTSKKFL